MLADAAAQQGGDVAGEVRGGTCRHRPGLRSIPNGSKMRSRRYRSSGEGEGLSARTVRYVATILRAALGEAVAAGMLARNPADPDRAKRPTAKESTRMQR